MAGDWIKMRCDLAEDPAVIAIAAKVKLDEFAVVGRLHTIWSWADRQSRDGHAAGVTHAFLDRKVQCEGFAQAMCDVGWLAIDLAGVTFPNFDRHNGKTAKERALSTRRQQSRRGVSVTDVTDEPLQVSRTERDKGVTREEKRREEIEDRGVPYEAIVSAYNRTMEQLPKVRELTSKRRTAIRARWSASKQRQKPEFWEAYFEECAGDDFLNGTGPYKNGHENWRPDFDYLLREDVVTRTFEKAMHRLEKQGAAS